jgi:WD40 repeat protein
MSEPRFSFAYVTGGTLRPGEPSYVERQADIELFQSLLIGEFCYVLSPRQMGKSSLMARTARRLEQVVVASAIVDLTQIGSERGFQAASQWYFGIANKIHQQLRIAEPLRRWWQERSDLSPTQRFTDFFREVVLTHHPGKVVVFVDEIDSTIGLSFADDFFAALRACFNARATEPDFERLTFALFGVATPDQLIRDPVRTPFNIGRRIDLSDFNLDEAKTLAPGLHADPIEATKRLMRVLYWTGGHPYLTQALCRAVRESEEPGTAEQAVDSRVHELFLTSQAQRQETNLKQARARLERPGADGRRLLQLYLRVRQGKSVLDQPMSPLFAQLKLAGIVKSTEDGRLKVRNHIYEAVFTPSWAKSAMPVSFRRQLAVITLIVSLLVFGIWYSLFLPRPYIQALQTAISDDAYNTAIEAYLTLRANPFSRLRAVVLMQKFWEQRGLKYALAGKRDESLLSNLQGLILRENEHLSRQAGNLVGSDYGRLLVTLRHQDFVQAVAFSPDGNTVLTGSRDNTAQLWDARSGKPFSAPLQHRSPVQAIAFSPDGSTVLTGSRDNTARLWDARSGKPLAVPLHHRDSVVAVAFSPDGRTVLTGSEDNTARLWDARSGKPLAAPLQHRDSVVAVAFSPDGRTVLTGSEDNTARLWDARSGKPVSTPLEYLAPICAIAFSPDGRTVLTGSVDGTAQLWDADSGKPLATLLEHHAPVCTVAFSPDNSTVLTGSSDGTARLWDARSGKPLAPPLKHQSTIRGAAFSPDGTTVLTGSADNTARLWDTRSGKPLSAPLQHQAQVTAVAFSPDGRTVLTGSSDHTARLWDARSGKPLSPSSQKRDDVSTVVFSPDGSILLISSTDNVTQLWDTRSGKPFSPPLKHQGRVLAAAFSQDSKTVLIGSDNTARLWDTRSGSPLSPPLQHQASVRAVAFSHNGRTVLTSFSDNIARLWDARSGKPLSPPLQHQGGVSAVAISPDGRTILTGSLDSTAQLWDARSGRHLSPPLKHETPVLTVAFSPDGSAALTGSLIGNARLWDARSGRPMSPPLPHQGSIRVIAFSPDGKVLVIATNHWVNSYSWNGQKIKPKSSHLLRGAWNRGFYFSSKCKHCLTVAMDEDGDFLRTETLNLDQPNDPPIQGNPQELLKKWQERLGLTFDEEMRPVPR